MTEAWTNFILVLIIQSVCLFTFVIRAGRVLELPTLLWRGVLIGAPMGLVLDLFFGNFLGLYSYGLGFAFPYVLLNAMLAYGLYAANILVFTSVRPVLFVFGVAALFSFYEAANLLYPVWEWSISGYPLVEVGVVFIGYLAGAVFTAFMGRRFFRM